MTTSSGARMRDAALPIRPDFASPPIAELVLSVAFEPLPLGVVQLARVWETYRQLFPHVEEKPPYQMPLEQFGQRPTRPAISLELSESIPTPRLWFRDAAGAHLIQLQNNWFARNWRKVPEAPDYPSYEELSTRFIDDLEKFKKFLKREGVPQPAFTQCEITYIDHIEVRDDSPAGLSSVLSLVADPPDFPTRPEGQQIASGYVIEHNQGPVGRLHVQANTAIRNSDGRDIVVLNLTARGMPISEGIRGVIAFQDLGREWAWNAFRAMTRSELQESWRSGS